MAVVALCIAAMALSAGAAGAATVSSHNQRSFSPITGAGTGVTLHNPAGLAVDEASGNVFLNDGGVFGGSGGNVVDIFNAEGGVPSGVVSPYQITGLQFGGDNGGAAVDNSTSSPSKGTLYVADVQHGQLKKFVRNGATEAYEPGGELMTTEGPPLGTLLGVAVDSAGNVYVGDYSSSSIVEFSPTGTQLARIGVAGTVGAPVSVAVDAAGDLFVAGFVGSAYKYPVNGSGQIEETNFLEVPASNGATAVGVDVGTNSLYVAFRGLMKEYDASALTETSQFGDGQLGNIAAIAPNATNHNIYVSDKTHQRVAVFGPLVTGTAPDVTADAPTNIGVSRATFNGTINPQGVPNRYFFEWKEGTEAAWVDAMVSSPQSISPADTAGHSVSFAATSLAGGTTFQVRLVAENTANGLRTASNAETFTTLSPSGPPALTIEQPAQIATSSATVRGTVNPKEDFGTTWRILLSTDPACETGFTARATHELESEVITPVPVEEELTGLLPNQHYCVFIEATNSAGATTSETKEFSTQVAPPDQVFTGFVAPRTDTAARLNGYVNPEGASTTYWFEYSPDGSTWTTLAPHDAGSGRRQSVVADELSGLEPGHTYHYRFFAENAAGPAVPQGADLTFSTRSTDEMVPIQRGVELVNTPDKGNQNVFVFPSLTASSDGNEALWSVTGGAPGGHNGSLSTFLAKRTATGWQSQSLAPPAAQQVGGGSLTYELRDVTPDFSRFLLDAQQPKVLSFANPGTLVRLDQEQHQQVLSAYEEEPREADITSDGSHVLVLNAETKQLEDIGDGAPEVVSIMPDGFESACGLDTSAGISFIGGVKGSTPSGAAVSWRRGYHMIATTDASRAYFEARPNGGCQDPYGLYVRNRDAGTTTLIDPGTAAADVAFIRATPDGRQAYFATKSKLDSADTNNGVDVYRWTEQSGESSCLTCVVPNAAIEEEFGAYNPIRISDDFSHIYFESLKRLVPGYGTEGTQNLYVLTNGALRFVTETYGFQPLQDAQLSHDGNVLLFQSQGERSLTADEVSTSVEGHKMVELYRYDDRDRSVDCLSCRHGITTTQAVGDGNGLAGLAISGDGATIAFVTSEALLDGDVNRKPDVYEWRDGSVDLITDGITEFVSGLLAGPHVRGMDSNGSNIFFSVADPGLTGFEQDGLANLYDARIGGGFVPPTPPGHCVEDSCQGSLQAAPPDLHPGTASYAGPGNAHAHRRCAGRSHRARKVRGQAKLSKRAKRCRHANRRAGR